MRRRARFRRSARKPNLGARVTTINHPRRIVRIAVLAALNRISQRTQRSRNVSQVALRKGDELGTHLSNPSECNRDRSASHSASLRVIRELRMNSAPPDSSPMISTSCNPMTCAYCNASCNACSTVYVTVGGRLRTLFATVIVSYGSSAELRDGVGTRLHNRRSRSPAPRVPPLTGRGKHAFPCRTSCSIRLHAAMTARMLRSATERVLHRIALCSIGLFLV